MCSSLISGLFRADFPTKILCTFPIVPVLAFHTPPVFGPRRFYIGEEYKLSDSQSCCFLQSSGLRNSAYHFLVNTQKD